MVLSLKSMLDWAAYLIVIGYIFDVLDGVVARFTGGGNKFGAELDNTADLITYSIAPAVLATAHYDQWTDAFGYYTLPVAALVGLFPILFGTIRFARFNVKRIEYPGVWFGAPRPATGLAIAAFLSSRIFATDAGHWAGLALIPALSVMNIALWPVVGHHNRKFHPLVKLLLFVVAASCAAGAAFGFIWDVLIGWTTLYIFLSWLYVSPDERGRIRAFVASWRKSDG
ncbi:MAG: CDP-alcohol phosphatidyltransferase family protein [Deltaproteobacteria bacterium]|nr:CDP-alcohol phosphatidyltransferase family protein [Deltaproteobacteria bacterium]